MECLVFANNVIAAVEKVRWTGEGVDLNLHSRPDAGVEELLDQCNDLAVILLNYSIIYIPEN